MPDSPKLIHDLPTEERPREKMQRLGASALSAAELIAIFLRTGTKGTSAIEIGQRLHAKYGSLSALGRMEINELSKEHGLGPAKACQLAAAFELGLRASRENLQSVPLDKPALIHRFFRPQLVHRKTECLLVASLTSRLTLHRLTEISTGSVNSTVAYVRDIVRPVLLDQMPAFIIAHNHPSGNSKPSISDDQLTLQLLEAAELLHLNLLDHLIVSPATDGLEGYYSYLEHKRLTAQQLKQ